MDLPQILIPQNISARKIRLINTDTSSMVLVTRSMSCFLLLHNKNTSLSIPPNQTQLSIRDKALKCRAEYEKTGNESLNRESDEAFWEAEFMLRKIFDMQAGDNESLKTIQHYPLDNSIHKRRANYNYLLEHLPYNPSVRPVFPELPDDVCPMFFPLFADNRNSLIDHLKKNQIVPKVYWPVPPFIDINIEGEERTAIKLIVEAK